MILNKLTNYLKANNYQLNFTPGKQFYWSPETKEIFYDQNYQDQKSDWSLLHETGHALLNHTIYKNDFHLLSLEVTAWEKAKDIAHDLKIIIDQNHIEDCLDTYRDWLAKRSTCPVCNIKSLQQTDFINYRCFNCHSIWKVTPSRFCRPYRSVII